ncbi:hypothetical protein PM082_013332 [Marasmius tenuissimus]|nr:hypothetical protein PM082_013332 [Marasmius tenuissimus]
MYRHPADNTSSVDPTSLPAPQNSRHEARKNSRRGPGRPPSQRLSLLVEPILSTPAYSIPNSQFHSSSATSPPMNLLPAASLPSPITPSNLSLMSPDLSTNPSSSHIAFFNHLSPVTLIHFDSKPRSRKPGLSEHEKIKRAIKYIVDDLKFKSVADFILSYSQNIPKEHSRNFGARHKRSLKSFLQTGKAAQLIEVIYFHRYSNPSYKSKARNERSLAFSPSVSPFTIKHARSAISSWAVQLVGPCIYKEVRELTVEDKGAPAEEKGVRAWLAASANE